MTWFWMGCDCGLERDKCDVQVVADADGKAWHAYESGRPRKEDRDLDAPLEESSASWPSARQWPCRASRDYQRGFCLKWEAK